MCGIITVVYEIKHTTASLVSVAKNAVKQGLALMAHRTDASNSINIENNNGHNRLMITGSNKTQQPFSHENCYLACTVKYIMLIPYFQRQKWIKQVTALVL